METRQIDDLLLPFTKTPDELESERLLSRLITEHAAPIVRKILKYKTRRAASINEAEQEAEEISSDVMLQLVQRLQNFRSDYAARPIEDFSGYVAVVTYNAYDRFVSRKYPNRRRLKNGLRYLLTHRAEFAAWQTGEGNFVGGFSGWQHNHSASESSSVRVQTLRDDARAFAEENYNRDWHDAKRGYELLTAIFEWTDAPVELDLLVSIVADWWNVTDETIEIDGANRTDEKENAGLQIADTRADASIENERRVYLKKLWDEIAELPVRQRAAILLNMRDEGGRGIVDLWLIVGVASAQTMAGILELTAEKFAGLWRKLPLDDNQIAAHLGLTRQQVINLRKSARERLARRMKTF